MKWTKYHIELAIFWETDLQGADLRRANLRGADLRETDLQGADLRGANLQGAALWGADLRGADLQGANLWGADLRGADLRGADLRGADLWGANLWGVDLQRADLQGANLRRANLWGANLWGADLQRADLWGADLQGADLRGADLQDQSKVPEIGSFIGFKKLQNKVIATIKICKTAKRCGGLVGSKCRASAVKVLSLSKGKIGYGLYNSATKYEVGKIVKADKWDSNIGVECTHGIHFFLTRAEAEAFSM